MADFNIEPLPRTRAHSTGGTILLVDEDDLVRDSVARILTGGGHEVVSVGDGHSAIERLGSGRFDLMLTGLKMPGLAVSQLLAATSRMRTDLPVVLMTAYTEVRQAVEGVRRGAYDYIQKPFEREDLLLLVRRTLEHARLKQEILALRTAADEAPVSRLVGSGQAMREVNATVDRFAATSFPVVIRGERGTGKEVAARLIHARSPRLMRPMLKLNCAALGEAELAGALFGQEKGSATATRVRPGRLELADGGTLLLDEVSELPLALQTRLIRVLQEGAFERPGTKVMNRVDVRIIATTSRRLDAAVSRGKFREDLYYRLNGQALELPPLRERREDIPELVAHFLHLVSVQVGQPLRQVEPPALRLLQKAAWPGNVGELKHLVERAVVTERDPAMVRASTLAPWLVAEGNGNTHHDPLDLLPLAEVERRVILETLAKFEGHRARTAGALGIGVRTLGIKLKKWREDGQLLEADMNGRRTGA